MGFQIRDYAFYKEDPEKVRQRMLDKFWEEKMLFIPHPDTCRSGDALRLSLQMERYQEEFERRFNNRVEVVTDGIGGTWQLHANDVVVPVGYKSKTAAASGQLPEIVGPPVEWRYATPGQAYMFQDVLEDARKAYKSAAVKGGAIGGGIAAIIAKKLLFR